MIALALAVALAAQSPADIAADLAQRAGAPVGSGDNRERVCRSLSALNSSLPNERAMAALLAKHTRSAFENRYLLWLESRLGADLDEVRLVAAVDDCALAP